MNSPRTGEIVEAPPQEAFRPDAQHVGEQLLEAFLCHDVELRFVLPRASCSLCVAWCGAVVAWRGLGWSGVAWCGVAWRGVVWCGVVWCGVVWCGVVWCGVQWCGVMCCGVVWCGVEWCGVV